MAETKAHELENAFKEKFEEINAEKIFKHLFLRNPEKLKTAIENYNGDEENLKRWINSFVASEKALSDKYGTSSWFLRNPDFFREVLNGD